MASLARPASEQSRGAGQQRESSHQCESQEIPTLVDEADRPTFLSRDQLVSLMSLRSDGSVNSSLFARAVTQLQQQHGNAYVQRLMRSGAFQTRWSATTRSGGDDYSVDSPGDRAVTGEGSAQSTLQDDRQLLRHRMLQDLRQKCASPTGQLAVAELSQGAEGEPRALMRWSTENPPVIRQRLPAGVIARDLTALTEEAEARTGRPSELGAMLTPEQQDRILTQEQHQELARLVSDDRALAVSSAWSYLRLPENWRIFPPPYATENLGRVAGVQLPGVARHDAVTIPYVLATPECFGSPRAEHWHRHDPGEIRAIIQVSTRVFSGPPEEAASRLVSTLLHEYTHVEWYVAEGFHERIGFLPVGRAVGSEEILSLEPLPSERESPEALGEFARSSGAIEALDEINAHCTEIENGDRTRLAETFQIKETVDELWRYYRSYLGRLDEAQPDVAVARRVYSCIERGRRMFGNYLASPQGRPFRSQRRFLLERCPEDYDVSLFPAQAGGTP